MVENASLERLFGRFFFGFLSIWVILFSSFIFMTLPILRNLIMDQANKRLETNAVLLDEYLSSMGAFSETSRSKLDMTCKRLNGPNLLDAWITIFSPKQEVIADSRISNPMEERMHSRPEVESAMENSVGTDIRYSSIARTRMAFVAYPHIKLGAVDGVIRLGIPFSSLDNPLWWTYMKIGLAGIGLTFVAAAAGSLIWQINSKLPELE